MSADRGRLRRDEVTRWLRARLADSLHVPPDTIRCDAPLAVYGMDSLLGAMLLSEIEDDLGVLVDPSDVPPGMTIDDLAELVLDADGDADGGHAYPKDSDVA